MAVTVSKTPEAVVLERHDGPMFLIRDATLSPTAVMIGNVVINWSAVLTAEMEPDE